MKIRIYEVQKILQDRFKLDIKNKDIVDLLAKNGFSHIHTASNSISEGEIRVLEQHYRCSLKGGGQPQPQSGGDQKPGMGAKPAPAVEKPRPPAPPIPAPPIKTPQSVSPAPRPQAPGTPPSPTPQRPTSPTAPLPHHPQAPRPAGIPGQSGLPRPASPVPQGAGAIQPPRPVTPASPGGPGAPLAPRPATPAPHGGPGTPVSRPATPAPHQGQGGTGAPRPMAPTPPGGMPQRPMAPTPGGSVPQPPRPGPHSGSGMPPRPSGSGYPQGGQGNYRPSPNYGGGQGPSQPYNRDQRPYPPREGGYQGPRDNRDNRGGYRDNRPQGAGPQGGDQRPGGGYNRPDYRGGDNRPGGGGGYRPNPHQGGQGYGPRPPHGGGYQGGDRPGGPSNYRRPDGGGFQRPGGPPNRFGGGPGGPRPPGSFRRDGPGGGGFRPGFREVPPALPVKEEERKRDFGKDKDKWQADRGFKEEDSQSVRRRKKGVAVSKRRQRRESHEFAREVEKEQTAADFKKIRLPEAMTVKDLAEVTKIPVKDIIGKLLSLGVVCTINQRVERSTLQMICDEYEFQVEFVDEGTTNILTDESAKEAPKVRRHPIVTILGHVDHGKTTLLDTIRRTRVVDKEHGGITQHIGAYTVEIGSRGCVTFLDTPGHEAFTAMRAHGANVTDIVILVVAADDGVMPQTLESIAHAQAAGVPIIVAVNKMDKPGANVDKIKTTLSGYNLNPEEWGGKTIYVPISGLKGTGIDQLLEMILLQAEMMDLKAPVDCLARGVVIEARRDKGLGVVATVLIQSGTLNIGDNIIAGMCAGRVKSMRNQFSKRVPTIGPSVAAEILGLEEIPEGGDKLYAVENTKFARYVSDLRVTKLREQRFARESRVHLNDAFAKIKSGTKELNIVLKTDTQGSLLALKDSFEKINNQEARVKVIYGAVGGITESDVMLAAASNAIIIGFHVRADLKAAATAASEDIEISCFNIIYDAIDTLQKALTGMYDPQFKEEILGVAQVKEVFRMAKTGSIAGCFIEDGKVTKDAKIRVVRDGHDVFEGVISSLRRFKDTVKEVTKGFECGILVEGFSDIKPGDMVQAFHKVEVKRG